MEPVNPDGLDEMSRAFNEAALNPDATTGAPDPKGEDKRSKTEKQLGALADMMREVAVESFREQYDAIVCREGHFDAFDSEKALDEQVIPLLNQAREICQENGMPLIVSVAYRVNEDGVASFTGRSTPENMKRVPLPMFVAGSLLTMCDEDGSVGAVVTALGVLLEAARRSMLADLDAKSGGQAEA